MTLAERLKAALADIVATKDAITALTTKESLDAAEIIQLDELTQALEKKNADYAVLQRAEKALATGAQPASETGAGQPGQQQAASATTRGLPAPAIATRGHVQQRSQGFDLLVRSAVAALEAYVRHIPVELVIERRWPGDQHVAETSKLMAYGLIGKAAQEPAMTSVAGWAAELVHQGYGAFMDALQPESVVPRIPMASYQFDMYGKIILPYRATTYPSDPNMSAAFRAEGAPIRVGSTQTASKILTPKTMAVIGTFTKELLARSTPNIEEAIRNWMLQDTAWALDVTFLDNVAGTAIRPAGLQNGIAAGDTRPSSGNTAQAITNDIMAMLAGLTAHNMGRRPCWIMNQARKWGLIFSRTPTGDPAFPGVSDNSLAGIPVVASTTVPLDIVVLVDAAEMGFAGGAPTFEGTDEASIMEDSGSPNADMVTGASVLPLSPPATPIRSLFQTHSAALKAVWEIDWTVLRPGAVQVLTGVAWGAPGP